MSSSDFPALERRILSFWKRKRCFESLLAKNRGGPRWSFMDGPITANNPMGVHHAWGRTYKDLYHRYHAMLGHEIRYQNGFDCQGLWVEVEVEKELGFSSKREIEEYGVARFVERCKERVRKYAAIQTEQSKRLGYWMDWESSYFTMSDENNYSIWQFLKRCHQRGFIYRGDDSMPWCPRCGTGISQHEISSEERPVVVHPSPTVRFPLLDRAGEYLLAWTTTPWTLTANVACAIHPEMTYARVRQGDGVYYLGKELVEKVMSSQGRFEVLGELSGEEMTGWRYRGPFDELPVQEGVEPRVIPWKEVSTAEGTGIVHIAPGCGKDDYRLGQEHGLPAIGPIDESGVFVEGFGRFSGAKAAEAAEAIFSSLRDKGLLHRVDDYEHAYPVCWRCKTQLLFRLVDEWYISMEELRHEIKAVTRQTQWIPEVGLKLELDWLDNMHDWMISKKRYWGLALPIYPCEVCGTFEVVGGRDELQERAVAGWEDFESHSPHRPWVDDVEIDCPGCGASLRRIPDVGNPWLDAGIVPYSTLHYRTDPDYWERWFPADLISESYPGQFRNWFYAILAMSTVMERRPPFRLLLGYRTMKDEVGDEMHKSKGNAVEFNEAAEKEGADAMRWLFAGHNPEYDLRFGWNKIHEARREFLTLWNVYQFYLTYAEIDRFVPRAEVPVPLDQRPELDRWILQRLEVLVQGARESYGSYAVHCFMRDLKGFLDALSRWYLRRSRRRFWKGEDDADKRAAYQTLHECLVTTIQLLAPVIPFATEEMYQRLVRDHADEAPVSVHLTDFPVPGRFEIDTGLLEAMEKLRDVAEQGHTARQQARLKVRQPVAALRVTGLSEGTRERLEPLLPLLEDELNVKQVQLGVPEADLYRLKPRLDRRVAGPLYKKALPKVEEALAKASPERVVEAVQRGNDFILEPAHEAVPVPPDAIVLERQPREGWQLVWENGLVVAVDTRLTDDLMAEGRARELVRRVQELRKELGFDIGDRIRILYCAADEVARLFEEYGEYVTGETLAVEVLQTKAPPAAAREVWFEQQRIDIRLERML
ncbi:MAG: isoleucine--tRNA ligase [bacterium]